MPQDKGTLPHNNVMYNITLQQCLSVKSLPKDKVWYRTGEHCLSTTTHNTIVPQHLVNDLQFTYKETAMA